MNVGYSYTQGFNELVSPLYYVMLKSTALFRNNQDDIEALSFSMLQRLITSTSLHEMYTIQDKSSIIFHNLSDFTTLLKKHIPKVYDLIEKKLKLHPATYCYRWFNLLFAQEYDMPSLLQLWDVIFAHADDILNFAYYIGLGQLKVIENTLQASESKTLYRIQNIEIRDVCDVINYALKFYNDDHKKKSFFSLFK